MMDNDNKYSNMNLKVLNVSLLQQLVDISKEHCLKVFNEMNVIVRCLYVQNEVYVGMVF